MIAKRHPLLEDRLRLEERIQELGPWFHNLRLGEVITAPDHFLGDYPEVKYERFRTALPADMTGLTVLDIGCNAGFYSLGDEAPRRGSCAWDRHGRSLSGAGSLCRGAIQPGGAV